MISLDPFTILYDKTKLMHKTIVYNLVEISPNRT